MCLLVLLAATVIGSRVLHGYIDLHKFSSHFLMLFLQVETLNTRAL